MRNPTAATDAGVHDVDDRLADFNDEHKPNGDASVTRLSRRLANADAGARRVSPRHRRHICSLRADLEGDYWNRTVLKPLQRNPTVYEGECANGIFSIVKRPYASDTRRVADAIGRLNACPGVLAQGERNLTDTVREFAQIASDDVRDGDSVIYDVARRVGAQRAGSRSAAVATRRSRPRSRRCTPTVRGSTPT